MTRPTLADIATQANVSEATVSRVLNDKAGVAESTRQAVLTALDLLGYERPQRLRRSSAGLVGLITPELTNPIFPALAQAIESSLARTGYTPVLCTQTPGGIHEDDYVQMLLDRGVAGIIYVSGLHADTTLDPERYVALRRQRIPIVLLNGYVEGVDAPFVSNDDEAAMELALSHLIELGHTRIGLAVGQERYLPAVRKISGFRRTMAARLGVEVTDDLIARSFYTVEGGGVAARSLLDNGCTGIVCASDLMALGAIREVRRRGARVPEDVSVVGHDDSPMIDFTDPPLTTVRQNVKGMGEATVEALVDEIRGVPAVRGEYMFKPELVVRGSTGAAPSRTAGRPLAAQPATGRPAPLGVTQSA